jgi:four helix bundle protein
MEKVRSFEDLEVWKCATELTVKIYELIHICKDYGLKDQMQRAAVSIPSNIAEGFGRQTNKEFVHFLYIAKGSCAELKTQLYISLRLNYISISHYEVLNKEIDTVSKMLYKLIQYRKNLVPVTSNL